MPVEIKGTTRREILIGGLAAGAASVMIVPAQATPERLQAAIAVAQVVVLAAAASGLFTGGG